MVVNSTEVFKGYPDIVDKTQLSKMLGICTKTACKILKQNKINHFKISRKYYIPKIHILAYLEISTDLQNINCAFVKLKQLC